MCPNQPDISVPRSYEPALLRSNKHVAPDGAAFLGVAEAAPDDARIERDHCSGAKHDDVFHGFLVV
jgi:hypothetical protein